MQLLESLEILYLTASGRNSFFPSSLKLSNVIPSTWKVRTGAVIFLQQNLIFFSELLITRMVDFHPCVLELPKGHKLSTVSGETLVFSMKAARLLKL